MQLDDALLERSRTALARWCDLRDAYDAIDVAQCTSRLVQRPARLNIGGGKVLEQRSRARGVRRAIAGRIVARHLHQFGEERGLPREVAIDEGADRVCERHGVCASWSTASSMTRAAMSATIFAICALRSARLPSA